MSEARGSFEFPQSTVSKYIDGLLPMWHAEAGSQGVKPMPASNAEWGWKHKLLATQIAEAD